MIGSATEITRETEILEDSPVKSFQERHYQLHMTLLDVLRVFVRLKGRGTAGRSWSQHDN